MATDLESAAGMPPEENDLDSMVSSGDSVVLHGVSWKLYRRLRKMPENYNIRMTYDRGELRLCRRHRCTRGLPPCWETLSASGVPNTIFQFAVVG